ncbi:unnamed protein product [Boreogadus saida]
MCLGCFPSGATGGAIPGQSNRWPPSPHSGHSSGLTQRLKNTPPGERQDRRLGCFCPFVLRMACRQASLRMPACEPEGQDSRRLDKPQIAGPQWPAGRLWNVPRDLVGSRGDGGVTKRKHKNTKIAMNPSAEACCVGTRGRGCWGEA